MNWMATTARPTLIDDRKDRWCRDASTETDRRETARGAVHVLNWTATTARPTLIDDRVDRWRSDASTETDRRETADGAVHTMT